MILSILAIFTIIAAVALCMAGFAELSYSRLEKWDIDCTRIRKCVSQRARAALCMTFTAIFLFYAFVTI